ncbi:hypothetical protein PQX77_002760 [Marasmius sp. AFHP31]|nr:hypothetical protein PQX77_002760 [Marasmius sp. AFHP31]
MGTEVPGWVLESFVHVGGGFVVFQRFGQGGLAEKDHESIRGDVRELMKYVQGKSQETDAEKDNSFVAPHSYYRPDSVIIWVGDYEEGFERGNAEYCQVSVSLQVVGGGSFPGLIPFTHVLMIAKNIDRKKYGGIQARIRTLWDELVHSPDSELQGIGFPLSLHRIEQLVNKLKTSALGSGLRSLLIETGSGPSTANSYWSTMMHYLGVYIVSLYPSDVYAETVATTTIPTSASPSLFVESDAGLEFLSLMHHIIVTRRVWSCERSMVRWMEAMDVVRRIHRLPEDHFPAIPGFFPFRPFSKLKEVLNGSSSAGCEAFLEYLVPLEEHWPDAHLAQQEVMVTLLTEHINNYPQPVPGPISRLNVCAFSPFATSASGMELISFVDYVFEEDPNFEEYMGLPWNKDKKEAWIKAMERVQHARGSNGAIRLGSIGRPAEINGGNIGDSRDNVGVGDVEATPPNPELSSEVKEAVVSCKEGGGFDEDENKVLPPEGLEGDHDPGQKQLGGPGADQNV